MKNISILVIMFLLLTLMLIFIIILLVKKEKTHQETKKPDLNENLGNELIKLEKDIDNILKNNEIFKQNDTNILSIVNSSKSKIERMSNLFSNDRTRGKYGEYALEIILEDIFGAKGRYWFTQYKLESGSIIDFLIKTGTKNENILIDAKFPSDDYMNVLESRGSEELNANFKKMLKIWLLIWKNILIKKMASPQL